MKTKRILSLALIFVLAVTMTPLSVKSETAYSLWVGGVQVTDGNLSGDGDGGGSWSYDPASLTLTLSDVLVTEGYNGSFNSINIYSEGIDLTVALCGDNTLSGKDIGIYSYNGSLSLCGSGGLTVDAGTTGVYTSADLTVTGVCSLAISAANALSSDADMRIEGGSAVRVTNATAFGISLGGELTIEDSKVEIIDADNYGIYSGNSLTVAGSTVEITANGFYGIFLKGALTVSENSYINVTAKNCAIYYPSDAVDGRLNITEPEGGYADSVCIVDENGKMAPKAVIGHPPVPYVDASGAEQSPVVSCVPVKADVWNWTSGWYAVDQDVAFTKRIEVSGSVNLILCDGVTLTAARGIRLSEGNSLTLWAQSAEGTDVGKLTARGTEEGLAGIGGNGQENGGDLTVNGGVIRAFGGMYGAGVGGGDEGDGGRVTVNAGKLDARGYEGSAGIGGGDYGNGGSLTVTGGTVDAFGSTRSNTGQASPGIGAGRPRTSGTAPRSSGSVTILGGTVTARAGEGSGTGAQAIGVNLADAEQNGTDYLTLEGVLAYASENGEPAAPADRGDICRGPWVKLVPCTGHAFENGVCKLCSAANPDYAVYSLWVGGVQATSERLRGEGDGGGSWSYDPVSHTLTLSDVLVTEGYNRPSDSINIYSVGIDLTVALCGDNTLSGKDIGIFSYNGSLSLCGSGGLTVDAGTTGVYTSADLTVTGVCSLAISAANALSSDADMRIEGGSAVRVTNATTFGIRSGGELTIEDSKVEIIDADNYGIFSGNSLTVAGSTVEITANGFYGIYVENAFTLRGNSYVDSTASSCAVYYESLTLEKGLTVTEPAGGYANGSWIADANGNKSPKAVIVRTIDPRGDVDGNGTVDTTDARLTLQYAVGKIGAEALDLAAADADGSGTVDTTDARMILQKAVGKITEWP